MERKPAKAVQTFLSIQAIITWFAVGLQFYLIILNRTASIPETIIRFFSFYTILTNILVALCVTILLLKPNSKLGNFFNRPPVLTAITLYITVVGIVYNLTLRNLWNPVGSQRLADELLHVIVPLLFILHWFIFVPKAGLKWKDVFSWLIYPFVYVICILIRGAVSGYYPYPFIDVITLGYSRTFLNIAGLFSLFFLLSLFFLIVAKSISRRLKVSD